MLDRDTLDANLLTLSESDSYGRLYNGKVEIMPQPSSLLELFSDISMVKVGSPTLIEKNNSIAKSYSSYVIEEKLEDNTVLQGFYGTVGVLVSNSQNKVTVYSGANASACTNLSVFGAEFVSTLNLTHSLNQLEDILGNAKIHMVNRLERIADIKTRLEGNTYTSKAFEDKKGKLLSTIDLSLFEYVKHSEKVLRDANSIYYDMPNSDWKLLSSMNDLISKQSPSKRIESTLALEKIFV